MELPGDVLIEVLAALRVKSLIRFTCVCKQWLSIIRSPDFASKQYATRLKIQSKNPNNEYDCVLATFTPACSISVISFENLTFDTAFKLRPSVAFDPPRFGIAHRDVIDHFRIYGPCNGVFLLSIWRVGCDNSDKRALLLWNPATRETIRIPHHNYDYGGCKIEGFGFDHVTNDYKVVFFNGYDANSSLVPLYSLVANSWNQVGGGMYIENGKKTVGYIPCCCSGGRKHHYFLYERRERHSLVSFDMVDEVFVQTPLSDALTGRNQYLNFLYQGSNHKYPTLCTLDLYCCEPRIEMDIWGLKGGYGPAGFWVKERSVMVPGVVLGCQELMLCKNMDLVYIDHDEITWDSLSTHQVRSLPTPADWDFIGYTESLVSIASFVQDHSSVEIGSGGFLLEPPPVPREVWQEEGFMEAMQHNLQDDEDEDEDEEDDDEDDDDSSTDSAFLMPEGPSYLDRIRQRYCDYEIDIKHAPHRKKERDRLYMLPYCLREVNQPMVSNPCTF